MPIMKRDEITERLKKERMKLNHFDVKSLAVFGSVARDEARPDSDIDILVEFNGPTTFDQYMNLKFYLEDLLGCRVDLVTRKGIRPQFASTIEREARRVA